MQLIEFTSKGLYCSHGDFYIDPWKPVNKAVITHAHSDHAKAGSNSYLCHHFTKPLLQARLGESDYQSVEWNDPLYVNGVKISLHPAGHIIGSSQIRVEYNNEVWVVSGDYKTENDELSGSFEPVPCNVFITESTFGLPIYNWQPQSVIYEDVRFWQPPNRNPRLPASTTQKRNASHYGGHCRCARAPSSAGNTHADPARPRRQDAPGGAVRPGTVAYPLRIVRAT